MRKVYGRRDFAIIGELIEPRTRVLDLGCGEGELLAWLKENKQVDGRGVEMEGARVQKAIARGASVYQGDLESAVEDYPDQTFDYVVLSQTLQETRYPLAVLRGMLRVGKRAIVAFPNFGHYSVRLAWLLNGRAPRTDRRVTSDGGLNPPGRQEVGEQRAHRLSLVGEHADRPLPVRGDSRACTDKPQNRRRPTAHGQFHSQSNDHSEWIEAEELPPLVRAVVPLRL